MSGRGIVEADIWRTQQIEAEERSSDPPNPAVGDWWVRADLNPSVEGVFALAELRIQGQGGVLKVPLIDILDQDTLGPDVYVGPRFLLGSYGIRGVGFVPVTDQGGALGSPRVATPAGVEFEAHDAVELSAIPDSAVGNYTANGFSTSTWTSEIGPNLIVDGTPSIVNNELNGYDVVRFNFNNNNEKAYTSSFSSSAESWGFVWVMRTRELGQKEHHIDGGSNKELSMYDRSDGYDYHRGGDTGANSVGSTSTNWRVWSLRAYNGNSVEFNYGSSSFSTQAASSSLTGFTVAERGDFNNSHNAQADYAELTVLTDAVEQDFQDERDRLANKYGL